MIEKGQKFKERSSGECPQGLIKNILWEIYEDLGGFGSSEGEVSSVFTNQEDYLLGGMKGKERGRLKRGGGRSIDF